MDRKGIICYPWSMHLRLTTDDIESACRELLRAHRRVTVRMVCRELRRRHNACGKSARVARILRDLADSVGLASHEGPAEQEIARLRSELAQAIERAEKAEKRALLAEERERAHQDFWAERYVQKLDELERQRAALVRAHERASTEEHLRLRQRIAWLERENALLMRRLADEKEEESREK